MGTEEHRKHVPKKCVFKFMGYTKDMHRIQLFPQTGHLLISAGLDSKIKLWSTPKKNLTNMHWSFHCMQRYPMQSKRHFLPILCLQPYHLILEYRIWCPTFLDR